MESDIITKTTIEPIFRDARIRQSAIQYLIRLRMKEYTDKALNGTIQCYSLQRSEGESQIQLLEKVDQCFKTQKPISDEAIRIVDILYEKFGQLQSKYTNLKLNCASMKSEEDMESCYREFNSQLANEYKEILNKLESKQL